LRPQWKLTNPVGVESLLSLPGVVSESAGASLNAAADWPLISETLLAAM
jgi:hypothetical protein